MSQSRSTMLQEIVRLRLTRYDLPSEVEAVALAHKDLVEAADYPHAPPQGTPCRMYAIDVLRQAAVHAPGLFNEAILQDCIRAFPKCNAASQINIIQIIGHLKRRDLMPFLEKVRDDQTKDKTFQNMVSDEAVAVLLQLRR